MSFFSFTKEEDGLFLNINLPNLKVLLELDSLETGYKLLNANLWPLTYKDNYKKVKSVFTFLTLSNLKYN